MPKITKCTNVHVWYGSDGCEEVRKVYQHVDVQNLCLTLRR